MTRIGAAGPGSGVGVRFLKLGIGEAAARFIAFGATVYLARSLGASTYGVIVFATAVLLYLSFITDCGVDMLGVQEIAADRATLFGQLPEILGARVLVGAVLVGVTGLAGLWLLPHPEGSVLAIYAFTLLLVGMGTRWAHLGLEQSGRAALARVLSEAVAAVTIVTLVRGPGDLMRVPISQLLGEGVGTLVLLRLLPPGAMRLRVRLRPTMVYTLLQRSWRLVLHAILGLATFNSDFIFLRVLKDSAMLGHYAVAYTLISFFLNLGTAYKMSLIPALTRLRGEPAAARAVYDESMAQVIAGTVPICIGGILVAGPLILLIFGPSYQLSAAPLQVLLLMLPLAFVRSVSQGALMAEGRLDQLLSTVTWAAGTNVALNLLLIPRWGMLGAAWATVITEVTRTVLAVVYVARAGLPMTHPRRFIRILVAGGLMAPAVWLTSGASVVLTILVGGLAYALALAAMGGIRFRRGAFPELTV